MRVSIVITTKNRRAALLACVESLRRSTFADYELIVIDDCSTDGTESLSAADFGVTPCQVFHAPEPLMMVKARNEGARRSRGEYVLFVDDDNVVDPHMLERLVAAADARPEYGIVGPSMWYLAERVKYMDYQRISLATGKTRGVVDESDREVCDSDGIPNVFMIRRAVFEACGYFDEALVQTYTEPDFALNARRHGFRCGIVKAAVTWHDVTMQSFLTPRSLGGTFAQKAYCLMRNRSVLVARYGQRWQKAVYAACFAWFWPLVYSVLVLRFRRWDLVRLYWAGYTDGMRYLLTRRLRNRLPGLLPREQA